VDALYVEHAAAAHRMATALAGAALAEDLVAESFARVISQLHAGRGPSGSFRSYLFATIRNRYRDVQRRGRREVPAAPRSWVLEGGAEPVEGPEAALDRSVEADQVAAAFDTLSEEWREVLWHLELRGRPLAEVATLLELTPAAVSSLAYRAREGLRVAFLDQALQDSPGEPECTWVRDRLSRYLRHRVSERVTRRIVVHLRDCRSCSAEASTLGRVNRRLAAAPVPVGRAEGPATSVRGATARACAQRQR
jgi:RNA polymerase sigma factor (sigma-70 family)